MTDFMNESMKTVFVEQSRLNRVCLKTAQSKFLLYFLNRFSQSFGVAGFGIMSIKLYNGSFPPDVF